MKIPEIRQNSKKGDGPARVALPLARVLIACLISVAPLSHRCPRQCSDVEGVVHTVPRKGTIAVRTEAAAILLSAACVDAQAGVMIIVERTQVEPATALRPPCSVAYQQRYQVVFSVEAGNRDALATRSGLCPGRFKEW